MTAEKLLSRLEGVIQRGEGRWSARCPAHNDKSPSLSIADAGGKVLLHCFTGCAAEDVLEAVGLSWRDLYPDRWTASYRAATANQGSKAYRRLARDADPLEIERMVLKIAAAQLEHGEVLTIEDKARVEVARQRLKAARSAA
jgi:hypothetical protein